MPRRSRKLHSALILLVAVICLLGSGASAAAASAAAPLTHSEARAHIEGFLDATFFKEPEARAKYVLERPGSLGVRRCHRIDPVKIECVGLVRSTGPGGEQRICSVAELTAHRGNRGQIGVSGPGAVRCRMRAAEAPAPLPPEAVTLPSTGLSDTEVIVCGRIYDHGLPAQFWFKWGRTKAYGHIAFNFENVAYDGKKPVEVDEWLPELRPDTTYHYRVVGITEAGKAYGQDRTFHTPPR